MNKLKIFLLAALLAASSLVQAAGQGGFPSRPRFQEGYIVGNSGTSWFGNTSNWNGYMAVGAHYNGTAWVGDQIFGGIFGYENASFKVYGNSGLTPGGTYTPTLRFSIDSVGVAAVTSTLTSTKACNAGYTRDGPNFCRVNTRTVVGLTRDTCTTDATLPADAKAVLIEAQVVAFTLNAVGQRSTNLSSYTDNTCATENRKIATAAGYEHTAVVGMIAGQSWTEKRLPLNASQDFFVKFVDDAGNGGNADYSITGYFD